MPLRSSTPRCLETFCCEAPVARLELLHRGRGLAQRVEQADAHRLAEDAKALGDRLGEGRRQRVRDRGGVRHVLHDSTTV